MSGQTVHRATVDVKPLNAPVRPAATVDGAGGGATRRAQPRYQKIFRALRGGIRDGATHRRQAADGARALRRWREPAHVREAIRRLTEMGLVARARRRGNHGAAAHRQRRVHAADLGAATCSPT
jgi:hypothetical protein